MLDLLELQPLLLDSLDHQFDPQLNLVALGHPLASRWCGGDVVTTTSSSTPTGRRCDATTASTTLAASLLHRELFLSSQFMFVNWWLSDAWQSSVPGLRPYTIV
jgi:hypothetical protein